MDVHIAIENCKGHSKVLRSKSFFRVASSKGSGVSVERILAALQMMSMAERTGTFVKSDSTSGDYTQELVGRVYLNSC